MVELHKIKECHMQLCDQLFLFSFMNEVGRDDELSFFSIFSHFGPFHQVLGQVKEYLLLELQEVIKVLYAVVCPTGFNLLCDRGQQRGVLKLMKNDHFLVFLAVLVLFPKFLRRLKSGLY